MEAKAAHREPWNKGKLVGQKAPFKVKDIWALRVHLQMGDRVRELALFNLGIDSKLRGCDLVSLRVRDVCHGDQVASRAVVMQHKTLRPVQFEITQATRDALQKWIKLAGLKSEDFIPLRTWARASTRASSAVGSRSSVWTLPTTGRIRCGERKRRSSIGARTTFAQFNCCSGTRSSSPP